MEFSTVSRRHVLGLMGAAPLLEGADPVNDFAFALIGDRTGSAQPQIYSRVWREALLLDPDFAVTIGDAIEGIEDAKAPAQWAEMQALWAGAAFPIHHTPGNHDIWNAYSEKLFAERVGHAPFYSFTHQNALFVVLDNSRTEHLAPAQLDFLDKTLAQHAARSPKMVFFHRPFWLPLIAVGSGEFDLHRIVKRHGVSHVFSGHGHQFVHLQKDGIEYLEIGSSGGSIDRGLKLGEGFRQGWFYHYFWIRVKGNRVAVTVRELPPPNGLGRTFGIGEWSSTGPKFDTGDPAAGIPPKL